MAGSGRGKNRSTVVVLVLWVGVKYGSQRPSAGGVARARYLVLAVVVGVERLPVAGGRVRE